MANTKTKGKSKKQTYSKDQVLHWYREMLRIRRFEERASQLYMQRKIRGFCHLYIGQEAVAVGLETVVTKDDTIITAYRDHGNGLARGMTANECMAELYGKSTGSSKGKGGSMHYFSVENNFAGGHGIVGAQIPLGAGIAFAEKYNETGNLCVCLMGDGAVRQGAFHEAFNMAMTWKLPVIYIVENNNYAMGTSVERTSNVTELYTMAEGYDMPSKPINGMDLLEVCQEMEEVVEHVRSGKGPYFVEMKTYRYKGHSMSDPAKYRTREELNKYKDQDPIISLKIYAKDNDLISQEEYDKIEEEIKKEVDDCVQFAEDSPWPDPDDIFEDVYIGDYPFVKDF
jgi:pyruvate dehydrogenase E1 component alpha subunit